MNSKGSVQYTPEQREKAFTDPGYINSRKYKYSLEKFKDKNEKGIPDKVIAYFLCMSIEEVTKEYEDIVNKIRQFMKSDI